KTDPGKGGARHRPCSLRRGGAGVLALPPDDVVRGSGAPTGAAVLTLRAFLLETRGASRRSTRRCAPRGRASPGLFRGFAPQPKPQHKSPGRVSRNTPHRPGGPFARRFIAWTHGGAGGLHEAACPAKLLAEGS